MSIATQLRAVERGMQTIASYPEWKNTPIILGESDPEGCGACERPQNGYRNGPLYGASVIEATMQTYELARKYGLTVEGAVTWAFEFENEPLFAPLRALATDGVDKPVLNAFRLMGMLGGGPNAREMSGHWVKTESNGALPLDEVVRESVTKASDVNAVATRDGSEVDVLVWNYHDADVEAPPARVQLTIDGLQGQQALASEFAVDAAHSNAYSMWQQMGSPLQPTGEQRATLETAGKLAQITNDRRVDVKKGTTRVALVVPREGMVLLRLREE
jgi:xylan 1,4-beta-xylosidase